MSIADLRRDYTLAGLRRADLDPNPIVQFQRWFDSTTEARRSATAAGPLAEVNAMTLATTNRAGHPSARVMLLKGVDERGFLFFTNYESRKGRELAENPHASLAFHWADLERQVCVSGETARLSREESETYFRSRPKGSRLAAWASHQSEVIENREVLNRRLEELQIKYPGDDVPMPPYWGGYVLAPERIEFWQGGSSRLHDRFCYSRQPDKKLWRLERLSP
jgi:pyridoxamine 5'-phosphate oxidase